LILTHVLFWFFQSFFHTFHKREFRDVVDPSYKKRETGGHNYINNSMKGALILKILNVPWPGNEGLNKLPSEIGFFEPLLCPS
jgi:hypothetical protein